MNCLDAIFIKAGNSLPWKWLRYGMLLAASVALTACNSSETKTGQTLAKVDGEEITVLQLNEELKRADIPPGQQEAARKQLLETLIDRQVLIDEAVRNKMDRTPEVMQAIGRAKAQIIAQAYLHAMTARIDKPSQAEIDDYFQKHPEFFTNRKQFDMTEVLISTRDFNEEVKSAIGPAKSLDEVVAWLDSHNVQYRRGHLSRTTADLPQEISARLQDLPKDHLFLVNEEGNTMFVSLVAVNDSPVTAKDAAPLIEQYLIKNKAKEMADTEIAHLRSLAKIEYLAASAPAAAAEDKPSARAITSPATGPSGAAAANL